MSWRSRCPDVVNVDEDKDDQVSVGDVKNCRIGCCLLESTVELLDGQHKGDVPSTRRWPASKRIDGLVQLGKSETVLSLEVLGQLDVQLYPSGPPPRPVLLWRRPLIPSGPPPQLVARRRPSLAALREGTHTSCGPPRREGSRTADTTARARADTWVCSLCAGRAQTLLNLAHGGCSYVLPGLHAYQLVLETLNTLNTLSRGCTCARQPC
eukprot:6179671-Pyramimonas_sp.AAC.1